VKLVKSPLVNRRNAGISPLIGEIEVSIGAPKKTPRRDRARARARILAQPLDVLVNVLTTLMGNHVFFSKDCRGSDGVNNSILSQWSRGIPLIRERLAQRT